MSFEINPCNAVLAKTTSENNCDINEINNLCYGICDAFNQPAGCNDKCSSMIKEKKKQLGRDSCNLQRPKPPVEWNQIPHYFPRLLKQTNNIQQAQSMCHDLCRDSRYPNSCIEMCNLDSMSVRDITPPSNKKKREKSKLKHTQNDPPIVFNSWVFWPVFILTSIFMIYIISMFIRILYLKLPANMTRGVVDY